MLTVSGKALGRRKPLFDDFSITPPADPGDGGTTLAQLIESIVRTEVTAYEKRQRDRSLIRVLSERQLELATESGKIDLGGNTSTVDIDTEQAIADALLAFEDGLYLVLIDDQEQESLDAQVYLLPDSRITFIRLTMLAGG
ncbi:hypothetical protein [Rhodopirellula sp. MGV]|uniref:hypothetical protein n=1 Tax=Rhodopirellula sp. MGV TaxID=2023130 RepID=UPI000B967164|nr:hypothetical protein [Rhodopirellula sp. MGV]OYP37489.1 hypothetical protein CGZ80_05000 [Rhodopirellula sp. MGV]PNY37891.1 hypothetical protein C2E31_05135 [Rhodopirellula baltica]